MEHIIIDFRKKPKNNVKRMFHGNTNDDMVEAKCANCGKFFYASIERLEHSGCALGIVLNRKLFVQITDFCSKKCEQEYLHKVRSYGISIKKVPQPKIDASSNLKANLQLRPTFYPLLSMLEDMKENEKSYLLTGKCALCGTKDAYQKSHIIPKCIIRWLIKTSATGHIINAYDGRRIQDGAKQILLCPKCEERFSILEKYFYENIFIPYQNRKKIGKYDERLLRFIVSVSWRTLQTQYNLSQKPKTSKEIVNALKRWRQYLLDESPNPGLFEHHLLFSENVESLYKTYPDLLWYTQRSAYSDVIQRDNGCMVVIKFPGLLIFSCIIPPSLSRLSGTRIFNTGILSMKQSILNDSILHLIIEQSEIQESTPMPSWRHGQIERDLAKRTQGFFASETHRVASKVDEQWRNIVPNLAQDLFNQLRQLIELKMQELDNAKPQLVKMMKIRNAIDNLFPNELERFGSTITTLLEKAKRKKKLVYDTVTLSDLIIFCCVSVKKQIETATGLYKKTLRNCAGNQLCSKTNCVWEYI